MVRRKNFLYKNLHNFLSLSLKQLPNFLFFRFIFLVLLEKKWKKKLIVIRVPWNGSKMEPRNSKLRSRKLIKIIASVTLTKCFGTLKKLLRGTLCEELLKGTSERMFWKDYREELLKITFERNFEGTFERNSWKELLKATVQRKFKGAFKGN